tara:strand:- start:73 stop:1083 length:1011 start_codon:yes stop_codon:yes gene_type:complete
MIKNHKFFYKNLKNIVILGALQSIKDVKKINDTFKLKTYLITSPSFETNTKEIKTKVFKKLDKSFKDFIKKNFDPKETLFVSFGPRWIFKKDVITKVFKQNIVNFHSTRLPLDAGGGGFSWRVMRNDRLGNCLAHLVDDGVDTGPILKDFEFVFSKDCKTPLDFEKENNENFLNFYKSFIEEIKLKKKFTIKHQTQSLRRYNPRLDTKVNGWVDWFNSSQEIYNFINAFDEPYAGASTFIGKSKVRLKDVHLHGGEINGHPFSSGIVIRKGRGWLVVATSDSNYLIIKKILNSNNKNILDNVKEGDRFYTPFKNLILSRSKRIFYNPNSNKSSFKK